MRKFFSLLMCIIMMANCAKAEDTNRNFVAELTFLQKIEALKIEYISSWGFIEYEGNYCLRFKFKDRTKEKEIVCPAIVTIDIVKNKENNQPEEVFYTEEILIEEDHFDMWTIWGEESIYATIMIPKEKIKETTDGKGFVKFGVKIPGYCEFEVVDIETDILPKVPILSQYELQTPKKGTEIKNEKYKGYSFEEEEKFRIDEVIYEFVEGWNDVKLIFKVSGQKTAADQKEADYSYLSWKLYDEDGVIVNSGRVKTPILNVGEKFRSDTEYIYDLEPGKYRIEFVDGE